MLDDRGHGDLDLVLRVPGGEEVVVPQPHPHRGRGHGLGLVLVVVEAVGRRDHVARGHQRAAAEEAAGGREECRHPRVLGHLRLRFCSYY